MADESPSRRERLTCKAYDPVTGGEMDVHISHDRLMPLASGAEGR